MQLMCDCMHPQAQWMLSMEVCETGIRRTDNGSSDHTGAEGINLKHGTFRPDDGHKMGLKGQKFLLLCLRGVGADDLCIQVYRCDGLLTVRSY
jgi:hypothetical protein